MPLLGAQLVSTKGVLLWEYAWLLKEKLEDCEAEITRAEEDCVIRHYSRRWHVTVKWCIFVLSSAFLWEVGKQV